MITNKTLKAWTAGFVRRWHTQPQLVDSCDMNHGHQHRCTVLLILFWPDSSRASIIDTLVHDQGEVDAGDMARPAKQEHPEIREILEGVEHASIIDQGFPLEKVTPEELYRRKFVDLLDSYVWMLRHKPHMAKFPEWAAQRTLLYKQANELNTVSAFCNFITEAEEQFLIT